MIDQQQPLTHLPVVLPVSAAFAGELDASTAAERLLHSFLSSRSPQTLRAYKADLKSFAAFTGAHDPSAAAAQLLGAGQGGANVMALAFRTHLIDRKLAPATINRRLAAVRSLVQMANLFGMVPWRLEIEGLRAQTYRDTRGPGIAAVRRILARLVGQVGAKAARDRAIVRLLYDLGLRRAEVCRLDVGDYDAAAPVLLVLGKGRREKERLTLPGPTKEAIEAWLQVRPSDEPQSAGASVPLFVSLSSAWRGHRLTGDAVYKIVVGLGLAAGVRTRPHGLRHTAISRVLDLTNGDIRSTQKFSRHKDVRVIERYDDSRKDAGGTLAAKLAEDAG